MHCIVHIADSTPLFAKLSVEHATTTTPVVISFTTMLHTCRNGASGIIGASMRLRWPHGLVPPPGTMRPAAAIRRLSVAVAPMGAGAGAGAGGETLTARVLTYWFGGERSWYDAHTERYAMWYGASTAVDDEIRTQFADDVAAAVDGRPSHTELAEGADPHDTLALIILLDQFTRNIYRGSPDAFAGDKRAAAVARRIVVEDDEEKGPALLAALQPARRLFFFMPLMHSESLDDQHLCVDAVRRLLVELKHAGPPALDMHQAATRTLAFAVDHRDTIARFGRFPHRNRALGRKTTAEELEYLQTANTYGQ